jgi:drug/metabolite transporter (DMT)-like permease
VILALPLTVQVTIAAAVADPPRHLTAGAVAGLAYVSLVSMCLVSMCLGFFAWYAGLARGGAARVGRLQLAQTLGWSALLLGEQVSPLAMVAAAAVIAATAVGRNARVDAARTAARPAQRPQERSGDRPETATQAAPG